MRHFASLLTAAALLLTPALAAAGALPGMQFSLHDWELVCDNTGTCRAAGYHDEQSEQAMSVLLSRKAGPAQAVIGEVTIGDLGDGSQALPDPLILSLHIDGRKIGAPIEVSQGKLGAPHVAALLKALTSTSTIEFVSGKQRWELSGKGAAGVLLKMDDFQRRVGSIGALTRRGTRGEHGVLRASAAPVVRAVAFAPAQAGDNAFIGKHQAAIRLALRATLGDEDNCPRLTEPEGEPEPLAVTRINATRLLVSMRCWIGAYNAGDGHWVINSSAPWTPVLVTDSGSDRSDFDISASHKGRGIGDCHSRDAWTWDGKQFKHTSSVTTGMCRMVVAGGTWELPRIVTELTGP